MPLNAKSLLVKVPQWIHFCDLSDETRISVRKERLSQGRQRGEDSRLASFLLLVLCQLKGLLLQLK